MSGPDAVGPEAGAVPPDDDEPVGSVAQEAFKLLRAVTSPGADDPSSRAASPTDESHEHVCSTGWCPVCQVVGIVRDHPDAIASVTRSALDLARAVRDLVDVAFAPEEKKQ